MPASWTPENHCRLPSKSPATARRRPFEDVVVCATGVHNKPELSRLALELGATSVDPLTDRVTHLIAEGHGGAKYLCALERKIPILRPSWITESHRLWQHGGHVDLAQSIALYRLPPFSGITVCITGIENIVRRTNINKAVTAAGGAYVKDLVRPVCVTHLLCSGEAEFETEKMCYAEKFNRAGKANPPIQIVWEKWFWDSLELGGQLDEANYQASLPRAKPFKNVVLCITGVPGKPELFKLADELGATCLHPLTDRVTHLIAESHSGAKYQCALEINIPILLPSWITESHRIWRLGNKVELDQVSRSTQPTST
ncbi:hypothetical protein C8R46DRAFT_1080567 [Mycena filopes]|nr:hypothetical protein C8R46DRAFT_1080567 [Mycena filopes]